MLASVPVTLTLAKVVPPAPGTRKLPVRFTSDVVPLDRWKVNDAFAIVKPFKLTLTDDWFKLKFPLAAIVKLGNVKVPSDVPL